MVDRLDVNAQLLRSILSALYEIPSIGGNATVTSIGGGDSANIPVPLPIVASATVPITVENQPISVQFNTAQSVSVTNSSLTVQTVPARTRYFATISATTMGVTTIATPPSNNKIRVIAFGLTNATPTTTVKFKSGATDLTGAMTIQSPMSLALPDGGLFETGVNQSLGIELSGAAVVGGFVVYELIPS